MTDDKAPEAGESSPAESSAAESSPAESSAAESSAADPASTAADPALDQSAAPPPMPPYVPHAQPAYAQPGYPQPAYAQPVYPQPAYDPTFAPIPRTPRSPWIAPQRKTAVVIISILAARVLLGIGGLVGAAVAHHRDHRGNDFGRAGFSQVRPHQPFGPNGRVVPRGSGPPAPRATPTPTA